MALGVELSSVIKHMTPAGMERYLAVCGVGKRNDRVKPTAAGDEKLVKGEGKPCPKTLETAALRRGIQKASRT